MCHDSFWYAGNRGFRCSTHYFFRDPECHFDPARPACVHSSDSSDCSPKVADTGRNLHYLLNKGALEGGVESGFVESGFEECFGFDCGFFAFGVETENGDFDSESDFADVARVAHHSHPKNAKD